MAQKFITKLSLFCFSCSVVYGIQTEAAVNLAKNQVLNTGLGAEVPTLDPQKSEDTASARVDNDLYEGLVTESEDGTKILPGVASHYEISTDGITYTFHLRPDAAFSDGSKITADDVVFSIRRLVDPKVASAYSYIAYDIAGAVEVNSGKKPLDQLGVKALDTNVVQIKLAQPAAYFIKVLVMPNFAILKKEAVEKFGNAFTQPGNLVSSGAYKLTYWKVGDKIIAEKNPHYWNAKNVKIQTVNYLPIVDANSELQMYQSGQINFTWNIPPDKFKNLKAQIPNEIKAYPFLSIYYYDFNNNAAPFKGNKNLRQAFSMALDRNVLTKDVTGRGESPAYDIAPVGTADYIQYKYDWESLPAAQRLAKAKELYKQAGYSKDKPLTVTLKYNTDVIHKKVATALASMWERAFADQGLKISMINEEWKVFISTRHAGDYQLARDGWQADYNDASSFLNLLVSNNAQNNSQYNNPKYDALMQEAAKTKDLKKRQNIFQNAAKIGLEDYPVIPIFDYVSTHLVKTNVGGYSGKNALDHMYSKYYFILE